MPVTKRGRLLARPCVKRLAVRPFVDSYAFPVSLNACNIILRAERQNIHPPLAADYCNGGIWDVTPRLRHSSSNSARISGSSSVNSICGLFERRTFLFGGS